MAVDFTVFERPAVAMRAPSHAMLYRITIEPVCLRAELFGRETVEETQEFLHAVADAAAGQQCSNILISVRASRPVFKFEQHGLFQFFKELAGESPYRIAMLGDSEELHISHDYAELLAQQHGVNIRSFRAEAAALRWFTARDDLAAARVIEQDLSGLAGLAPPDPEAAG
jgi:hypothetical protein